MGILDRLRGKSGGRIEVVVEPTAAGPGQEIMVRLDLKEELDDKAQEVRAGITCTGRYLVKERDRDANGNVDTDHVWRSVELHEEVHVLQLAEGPQQAAFILPDHAQPASADCVVWEAWARVDRARGLDIVERIPLTVRIPSDRIDAHRDQDATADGLTLTDVPATVREGETLRGRLAVQLADDVKGAVKVRLHRRATYTATAENDYDVFRGDLIANFIFTGNKSKIVRDECVAEVELTDKQAFEAGVLQQLEFAVDVPAAGPTSSHQFGQIDWRVEVVVDRRLRGDLAVEAPLLVL